MGLSFDTKNSMPDGMRKLLEEQFGNQNLAPKVEIVQSKQPNRKFNNQPTERVLDNGEYVKFASKKEAARYDYLALLLKDGKIRNLKMQVQYLIKPSYIDGKTGERYRALNYLADFEYEALEDGKWVKHIEDTKGAKGKGKGKGGTRTQVFINNRKILAERGIYIEEV